MTEEEIVAVVHALHRPDTASAAIEALRGSTHPAAIAGLVECICDPGPARETTAALEALASADGPIVAEAIVFALRSPHSSVRVSALHELRRRKIRNVPECRRILERDESWLVRRAALHAISQEPEPGRWAVLAAADDPHWRVRHALVRVLLRWSEDAEGRESIRERLARLPAGSRVHGVSAYLAHRWGDSHSMPPASVDPFASIPFWDWDDAVLLGELERKSDEEMRESLAHLPILLIHGDERVRSIAAKALRKWGERTHLVRVAGLLDEPRHEGATAVRKLLNELGGDRIEDLARGLLHAPDASPGQLAWAIDQVEDAFPAAVEETRLGELIAEWRAQSVPVRASFARLAGRWPKALAEAMLGDVDEVAAEAIASATRLNLSIDSEALHRMTSSDSVDVRCAVAASSVSANTALRLVKDADVRVRATLAQTLRSREEPWAAEMRRTLQEDANPLVRAAAMTTERAAQIVANPSNELSRHVLEAACRSAKTPVWKLPKPVAWTPPSSPKSECESVTLRPAIVPERRLLGPGGLEVTPLGISGHYGLPVAGFARAYEAGVNLMFWEPNYGTMTDFFARIAASDRRAIHAVAGTFEADDRRVERDVERALRSLRVERLAIFLVFWMQSWKRISAGLCERLERLRDQGKIASFGLSTHSWDLAGQALAAGWDPIMVRHNAAHRRAETHVFPKVLERGVRVLTFSNTCYGRLLEPRGGLPGASAADCYRYTLRQPAVAACFSAPATLAQLDENLDALRDPAISDKQVRSLEEIGDRLYEEETIFRNCIRFA
jgi:aryl-alcohol dehydrogenase-like predicted oxidoreductase